MSQHDQNIANQSFPSARADINSVLGAIFSNNSGSTAPSVTNPFMWWVDTSATPNVLKVRNSADSGWVSLFEIGTLDQVIMATTLMAIKGSAPALQMQHTGGATNEKIWRTILSGTGTTGTGRMIIQTLTDAGGTPVNVLEIARSGTGLSGILVSSPVYGPIGIFTAAGSANAYTGTLTPAITSVANGLMVTMVANFTNTASATLNLNAIGAVTIKKLGATNLASGDIVSGQLVQLQYDGTNWQMLSPTANAGAFNIAGLPSKTTPVAADIFPLSDSAASGANKGVSFTNLLAAITGRFLSMQVFTANGTYSTPAGVTKIIVFCLGAGGGGYSQGGSTNISVNLGSNGGTSSFATECSATGGEAANCIAGTSSTGINAPQHGIGTGGDINTRGGGGDGGRSGLYNASSGNAGQYRGNDAGNGGFSMKVINSPAASYAVTVGSAGAAGTLTSVADGRNGAAGLIYVMEFA